jgi:NADPH-dependent ferric siderophore reductase
MEIEEQAALARHPVTRIRRDPVRRLLTVIATERLTPHMLRVQFSSPELAGFDSAAPDDHIKLIVPPPFADGDASCSRDYTPRAFDTRTGVLTIDFALHDAGPATRWALAARPGDQIQIGGPKGSTVVADDFDWYLLIGDETALPSIGRRLEELRADAPVRVVAIVDGAADRQAFAARDQLDLQWLTRDGTGLGDADIAKAALAAAPLPLGEGFVWIAAEAKVARALREYVIGVLGHPKAWTKASGYWTAGAAGTHISIKD